MIWAVLGIIILFLIYCFLPNYFYRNLSNKIIKKFDSSREIALTFDDGPDSVYTPILLDLLKKYNIKATFFLVAEKAIKNKKILYTMISEGHDIGLHSLKHKSAWISLPWQTKDEFERSLNIFKELDIEIKTFRPPWGTFNLLTQYNAKKHGLKTVLWTLSTRDWSTRITSEFIKNKILDNIKAGDIIVLHDSNGTKGTPMTMIRALEDIIPELINRGYNFITVNEKLESVQSEEHI